jgi:glycerate kinase
MKVLIAPDKFKGSLTAAETAAAMVEGVKKFNADWVVQQVPIADGGEGTAEILTTASGGKMVKAQASDPFLRFVSCQYGVSADGSTAFIDMSEASGLHRLLPREVNAMRTSSIGTGQLISHALNRKYTNIVLGLGGTATVDCGIGIAHALGVSFLDEHLNHISPIAGNLDRIENIETHNIHPSLARANFVVLADVLNPLLGEQGVALYAPQKGVPPDQIPVLHKNLEHFANLMEAQFGLVAKTPGFGAAGGAAACCVGLLGAKLANGAEFVLDALKLPAAIASADLVLTGEGCLDAQSLQGKAAIAVSRQAQTQGKPVVAVCGRITLSPDAQAQEGITLSGALVADPEGAIPENSYRELVARTVEVLREIAPRLE